MNLTRAVVLGVAGGALAAWLASASTSGPRPIAAPAQPRAAAMEKTGAELAVEIARLHDRLHPSAAPSAPSRNLFDFAAVRPAPAPAAATTPAFAAIPAPAAAAAPPMTLLGIGDDNGVRTAILSKGDALVLAKVGDPVGDAYTVLHIDATAVELAPVAGVSDGRTLRLALK